MMDTRAGCTVGVGRVSASRRASSATAYHPGWTAGSSASSAGSRDAAISAGVGAGGGTSAGAIAWTVSVMTGRPVRTGGGTCTGCFTDVSRAGIGVVSCSSGDASTSDEAWASSSLPVSSGASGAGAPSRSTSSAGALSSCDSAARASPKSADAPASITASAGASPCAGAG